MSAQDPARPRPRPRLSTEARRRRDPPSPDRLVGALHDAVHRESGEARAVRPVRADPRVTVEAHLVEDDVELALVIGWRGARPAHVQVADHVVKAVESGRLEPGQELPSIRDLARLLGVSARTAHLGLREAESRGVLSRGARGHRRRVVSRCETFEI